MSQVLRMSKIPNMSRYKYNNIIIEINVMSEILSARFAHPGTPQLTILHISQELEHSNNES